MARIISAASRTVRVEGTMLAMTTWDVVLLAVAGYFAVTTLVRLMKVRRDQLMAQLREDFDHEQVRLAHEKKKRKRKEAKE
ncbi:MAG: hypothetical protein KDA41_08850, partial [Planctomycetales bacterium]|nr:hypothetical protein [Planctomycetales bacterium]